MADVSESSDVSVVEGGEEVKIETTCPVATECILTWEPTREKK